LLPKRRAAAKASKSILKIDYRSLDIVCNSSNYTTPSTPIIPAEIPNFSRRYLRLDKFSSEVWVPNFTTLGDKHGRARGVALHSKLALDIIIEAGMLNGADSGSIIDSVAGISRISLADLHKTYRNGHPAQERVYAYRDRLNRVDVWEADAVPLLLEIMGNCFSLGYADKDTIRAAVSAARGAASDAVNAHRGGRKAQYAEWLKAAGESDFTDFLTKGAIGNQTRRWVLKSKKTGDSSPGSAALAAAA